MGRLLAFVLASSVALAAQAPRPVSAERILAHVKWLASDELGGRGNGLDGLERAGTYVREQFRDAGLDGAIAGGFDQPFDTDVRIDPPSDTSTDHQGRRDSPDPDPRPGFLSPFDCGALAKRCASRRRGRPGGVRRVRDLGARAPLRRLRRDRRPRRRRAGASRTNRRSTTPVASSAAGTSRHWPPSRGKHAKPASGERGC